MKIETKKSKTSKRFPEYDLIPTSHLLDSVWLRKDKSAVKIVFATGQVLDFRELKENEKSL